MNATPPPGWYPDNVGSGQRYWDGKKWTDHTVTSGVESSLGEASRLEAAPPGAPTGGAQKNWFLRHKVLSGVLAFVLILILAGAIGSGEQEDSTSDGADTSTRAGDDSGTEAEPASDPEPIDTDGDGASDGEDFRPKDPKIQTADDVDTDRDGVRDGDDFGPNDPKVQTRDDVDTDRDGVPDYKDAFPKDARYSKDTDGDGVADSEDAFPADANYSKDTDGDRVADSEDAFPGDSTRSEITLAMENALESAEGYLDYSAFSRLGLIGQLTSEYGEGYGVVDATWAVDQLNADWREQAVKSAKSYLEFSSFSRQGLIDQLSSDYGDRFTVEEATYAVNKIGL
jgi:hypothetical protein